MRAFVRSSAAVLAVLALASCGESEPTTVTSRPRLATTGASMFFNLPMTFANEITPSNPATSQVNANARIWVNGTTGGIESILVINNPKPVEQVHQCHIHKGVRTVNGPIRIFLMDARQHPHDARVFTTRSVGKDMTLAQEILADPTQFYVNCHSLSHTSGAARAQLQ